MYVGTEQTFFINGRTNKHSLNDSHHFHLRFELLHAVVASLSVMVASTNRRVVKCFSYVDYGTTA